MVVWSEEGDDGGYFQIPTTMVVWSEESDDGSDFQRIEGDDGGLVNFSRRKQWGNNISN